VPRGCVTPCVMQHAFCFVLDSKLPSQTFDLLARFCVSFQDMAVFFAKVLPRLRKVFLYYCRSERTETDNAHTMSLREFCQLLVDAGIYTRDRLRRRAGDITMKQVRMAFSGVQNESDSRKLEEEWLQAYVPHFSPPTLFPSPPPPRHA